MARGYHMGGSAPSTRTISVRLYSAANDTVTYTDIDGNSQSVNTNTNGYVDTQIKVSSSGSAITFASSVADNPSNLSQRFSKEITVMPSDTAIYVMPDGEVVYWYGFNKNGNLMDAQTAGFSKSSSFPYWKAPTFSTNYVGCITGQDNTLCAAGTNNAVTVKTVHAIGYAGGTSGQSNVSFLYVNASKGTLNQGSGAFPTSKSHITDASSTDRTVYIATGNVNNRYVYLYALWGEV